jgi:hypothetical protein
MPCILSKATFALNKYTNRTIAINKRIVLSAWEKKTKNKQNKSTKQPDEPLHKKNKKTH